MKIVLISSTIALLALVGCANKPTSECVEVGPQGSTRLTHCYVDNGIRGHGGPVVIDRYAFVKDGASTQVKHIGGAANVGTAQGVLQNLASSVPVATASVIGDHMKAQAMSESSGGNPVFVNVGTRVDVDQNGGCKGDCDL